MTKLTFASSIVGAAMVAGCFCASSAWAGGVSFLSNIGVDAGQCNVITSPCRTFGFALTQTFAGGEIIVLNPGDFGPVVINKALTLTGVEGAGISVSAFKTGIVVTAGATDSVNIIGLSVDGHNTSGSTGIRVNVAQKLVVKNCQIRNLQSRGIFIAPSSALKIAVEDTTLTRNGAEGIVVAPVSGGAADGALNRVDASNNNVGVLVDGGANITISNSVFSANSVTGVQAGDSGPPATTGTLRISDSMSVGNASFGVRVLAGSTAESSGTNLIRGNGANISGTLTNVGTQ